MLHKDTIRDPERDLVYCPGGDTLRMKSIKKNGSTRYANKQACSRCPYRDKYVNGKGITCWKEMDFGKDSMEKKAKWWEADGTESSDEPADVYFGISIWDNKSGNGSSLLSAKRKAESGGNLRSWPLGITCPEQRTCFYLKN